MGGADSFAEAGEGVKAKAVFRAWLWAEGLFMGYLLLRKEPVLTDEQRAQLAELEEQVKERLNAPAKNQEATPPRR